MSDDMIPGDGFDIRPSQKRAEPDAHGQAGLLLTESLLHALHETGALTLDQAVGVVRTACEVKIDVAAETGESEGRMRESLGLLARIEESLTAGGDH